MPNSLELSVRLRAPAGHDRRQYNLPTADEVSVLLPGKGSDATDGHDIILHL